jgi:hypothetical protein
MGPAVSSDTSPSDEPVMESLSRSRSSWGGVTPRSLAMYEGFVAGDARKRRPR